ncbi:MAG: serine hydrolase domain-containing protein [Isosphaeraceae bacterium]
MKRILPFALLLIAATPATRAQSPADPALSAEVRRAMQPFVDSGELAGVVALVGDRDKVLALEAIGKARIEDDRPMRPDTVFRIASMTKPITAIAIMMLADEGKLRPEEPVAKYLPEFQGQKLVAGRDGDTITLKSPRRPITLRDLLTHTSGLPGGPPQGLGDLYTRRNHTLAEAVMAFSQRPLEFEPGTKWAYCNAGIDTLGRVVEVVSGQSYEDFLKSRIFGPLGMDDTAFYPPADLLARSAMTYDRKDGMLVPASSTIIGPPQGAKYPIPAGGLYSTAPDMARLYRMMLHRGELDGRRYLTESAVAEMTRLQTGEIKTGFVDGMGFGYGWAFVREPQGVTAMLSPGTFGHGGAFGTQGWIDPAAGRFVVLMIQRTGLPNSDASDFRKALQQVAFPSKAK